MKHFICSVCPCMLSPLVIVKIVNWSEISIALVAERAIASIHTLHNKKSGEVGISISSVPALCVLFMRFLK